MTHRQRIEMYLREGRTVSGGTDTSLDASHWSDNFMKSLMGDFSAQYGKQQNILSFLQGQLTSMFKNPTGFSPATLSALNSMATNNVATGVQNATQAAQLSAAAHGGSGLPSGVQAQVAGQIDAAGSTALAGEKNQIAVQNGELQNQNQWAALSGLEGVSAQENPLGYAGASAGEADAIANLGKAQAENDANNFGTQLGAGVASGFGKSVGGALGGEVGGDLTGLMP